MKIRIIHEPIYNTHLTLIYDVLAFEAEDWLREKGIRANLVKCSGQTGAYTVKRTKQYEQIRYYIYIEKGKQEALLHELVHLAFMSLQDCGIVIKQETDEIIAYYLEWWYKRVSKIMKGEK